jgi:hypothetical protein
MCCLRDLRSTSRQTQVSCVRALDGGRAHFYFFTCGSQVRSCFETPPRARHSKVRELSRRTFARQAIDKTLLACSPPVKNLPRQFFDNWNPHNHLTAARKTLAMPSCFAPSAVRFDGTDFSLCAFLPPRPGCYDRPSRPPSHDSVPRKHPSLLLRHIGEHCFPQKARYALWSTDFQSVRFSAATLSSRQRSEPASGPALSCPTIIAALS